MEFEKKNIFIVDFICEFGGWENDGFQKWFFFNIKNL